MTKRPWNINDALSRIGEKHGETLRRLADGEGAAWTDKDTEALTGLACCDTDGDVLARAADHIEALEKQLADFKAGAEAEARAGDEARARVKELEAERAEVAKELRRMASLFNDDGTVEAGALERLATRLERKGGEMSPHTLGGVAGATAFLVGVLAAGLPLLPALVSWGAWCAGWFGTPAALRLVCLVARRHRRGR